MDLIFEHNYQNKYLELSFAEPTVINTTDDILKLREAWLKGLSSWHSPYKAIIDLTQLTVGEDSEKIQKAFVRMETLLKGFFLKKAVTFGGDKTTRSLLPFESFENREEAFDAAGIRAPKKAVAGDLRSALQIQNHFRQHVMEISLSESIVFSSVDQVQVLKAKITNNLMQWHSAWNLMFDCSNFEFTPEVHAEVERMLTFFRGFFLKDTLGYAPKTKEVSYPFKVYRSRHNAAGRLENEGNVSGEDANCQSRQG